MARRDYNEFTVILGATKDDPIAARIRVEVLEKQRPGKMCFSQTPEACAALFRSIDERVERKKRPATIALYAPLHMQDAARRLADGWNSKEPIEVTIRDY